MAEFTAIVPIDLVSRPADILKKSLLLAQAFAKHGARLVFSHNDRGTQSDRNFATSIARQSLKGVTVVSGAFYTSVVNPSLLRNIAAPLVETPVMLLLDVDIWPDMELFQYYADKVGKDGPFFMLPCLYLTESGTKSILSGSLTSAELGRQYFNFSRKQFLHLASPSSVTFLSHSTYLEMDGFDEKFSGHGYEDFDFMVRLALHYRVIDKTSDFMVNAVARSPLFAQGYRRELGRLVIPSLINKHLVYHLHHERGERVDYSTQRQRNFELFKAKHGSDISTEQHSFDRTLLTAFVCAVGANGGEVSDYGIYFDNKPGHIDRFDTFKRRLRFLFDV